MTTGNAAQGGRPEHRSSIPYPSESYDAEALGFSVERARLEVADSLQHSSSRLHRLDFWTFQATVRPLTIHAACHEASTLFRLIRPNCILAVLLVATSKLSVAHQPLNANRAATCSSRVSSAACASSSPQAATGGHQQQLARAIGVSDSAPWAPIYLPDLPVESSAT
nr:hypothetical protein CFP56_09973 [Quercus suber]